MAENVDMLEVVDILDDKEALVIPESRDAKLKAVMVPMQDVFVMEAHRGDIVSKDFVESIATFGMTSPIRVKPIEDSKYELIDGWRRFQAATVLEWKKIPAIIETRDTTELQDTVTAIIANYQRSENFTGTAMKVWELYDAGLTDQEIADLPLGMSLPKVREFRDMRKLHPDLWQAAMDGNMKAWSCRMAGRMDDEKQAWLVEILNETGRVTKKDIEAARQVGHAEAIASLPSDMFNVPELEVNGQGPYHEVGPFHCGSCGKEIVGGVTAWEDDSALCTECDPLSPVAQENGPQSDETYEKVSEAVTVDGKVSRKGRYKLVSARLKEAKAEMVKIKAPRKSEEADILSQIEDLMDRLAEMSEEE